MNQDPTYNTLMAVAAGVGLLMLVALGAQLGRGRPVNRHAWAGGFAALALALIPLGLHMTLTWPLSGPTAFDNIAFGEPSLAMGILFGVGAYLLGSDRFWLPTGRRGGSPLRELTGDSWPQFATLFQPLSYFAFPLGLGLIGIGLVGPIYTPWEAPPQEPITGEFTDVEWLENWFLAVLYWLTGIGALLTPFALHRGTLAAGRRLLGVIGVCWAIAGTAWMLFGALNYYTHIGLSINTYEEAAEQQATEEAGDVEGATEQEAPAEEGN